METLYKIISSEIEIEGNIITMYGIETCEKQVSNITCDKGLLELLVEKCNRNKLSTIHIHDVCEDFLAANY